MGYCEKLPEPISISDFGGNWETYVEELYRIFKKDFITKRPTFLGKNVDIIHQQYEDNKERSFWHIVSSGTTDDDRQPDFERCEKIGWAGALIRCQSNCENYKVWVQYHDKSKKDRYYILCALEKYLVVLEDRGSYLKLITAYPVCDYMVKKYIKNYNNYIKTKTPT